jgi:hypothetical protein
MVTKLEAGWGLVGPGGEAEAAEHNQYALRGDGIGNDDGNDPPPEPSAPSVPLEHIAALQFS